MHLATILHWILTIHTFQLKIPVQLVLLGYYSWRNLENYRNKISGDSVANIEFIAPVFQNESFQLRIF